jgi:hypothetical protein
MMLNRRVCSSLQRSTLHQSTLWWKIGAGAAFLWFLRWAPLHQDGSIAGLPSPCGFYHLTGYPCPLCGLTRSWVCCAQGDWSQAAFWHPLGPLLFCLALLLWSQDITKVLWPQATVLQRCRQLECATRRHLKYFVAAGLIVLMLVWLARLQQWIASPF